VLGADFADVGIPITQVATRSCAGPRTNAAPRKRSRHVSERPLRSRSPASAYTLSISSWSATDRATACESPVSITTSMPSAWRRRTASDDSVRTASATAKTASAHNAARAKTGSSSATRQRSRGRAIETASCGSCPSAPARYPPALRTGRPPPSPALFGCGLRRDEPSGVTHSMPGRVRFPSRSAGTPSRDTARFRLAGAVAPAAAGIRKPDDRDAVSRAAEPGSEADVPAPLAAWKPSPGGTSTRGAT
jgi:hypothetical protein